MIKALIVEDKYYTRKGLITMIESLEKEIIIIGECENVQDAIAKVNEHLPDLVLLDINLPDGDAFDFIDETSELNYDIIFITSFDDFAIRAIKKGAVDYILKPVDPIELEKALDKILTRSHITQTTLLQSAESSIQASDSSTINLPQGQDYHIVKLRDIIRVEGSGSYATFFLKNDTKIIVSKRLKIYVNQLESKGFIRTHQSHLVNQQYIKIYSRSDGNFLIMDDGSQIPVSAKIKPELKKRLKL